MQPANSLLRGEIRSVVFDAFDALVEITDRGLCRSFQAWHVRFATQ